MDQTPAPVCRMPAPRPVCGVTNVFAAGTAARIDCAHAAGRCSAPNPRLKSAIEPRPTGA
jgi:hypothetical protein